MTDETPHVMDSPTPLLMVVAGAAVLVLGGLFTTAMIWEASGPATGATTHASAPKPPTQPATPHG